MSVRGWVFVAMLMSVAVLVKPALKVAWPPEPDPAVSDDTGAVADGSDQMETADPSTVGSVAATPPANPERLETPPPVPPMRADRDDRTDPTQFMASDNDRSEQPLVVPMRSDTQADGSSGSITFPSAEPSTTQSDMADITRSIVRDYAARRERALLSPSVAATSVPPQTDEARQSERRAIADARRASDLVVAEAEDKLEAEQKRTSALADELENARNQLAAVQTTVGQLRDAVTSADSRTDDWHRAAEKAQAEVADTKDALTKVTAEVSDTKEALAKSRTENADAATTLAQLRSEAADTADRQKELDRAAASRVEEVQQQLAAESTRAADLSRELDAARAQLADVDRQKTADAEERRNLEAVSKDLDAKLQDERKKNAALAADLATAQATMRQMQEQAKALQAAAVRPSQPGRAKKLERGVPEAQMAPRPASPTARSSSPSEAVQSPRRDAKLIDGDLNGTEGPASGERLSGRHHGRSGEVIGYIPVPVRDEGITTDDYSPHDTSDHTVYVDEYVSGATARAMIRRGEITLAKRSVVVR